MKNPDALQGGPWRGNLWRGRERDFDHTALQKTGAPSAPDATPTWETLLSRPGGPPFSERFLQLEIDNFCARQQAF